MPLTITRGLAAMMLSGAPCGQVALAPVCKTGPGMDVPFQVIVSAPLLMMTDGPTMAIEAPCPLVIVMPAAPIMIIAPVSVLTKTSCAGLSDRVTLVPSVVCRWMLGVAGVPPASASGGKPAGSGQKAPLQIG